MKHLTLILIALVSAAMAVWTAGCAAETAPADAQPCTIVVPKGASYAETLAAKEVRRYVYLRTGRLLPIIDAAGAVPEKGDVIRVEAPQTAPEMAQSCTVASLGREVLTFEMALPETLGPYTLVADLPSLVAGKRNVRSLRDFRVVAVDIARGKPATASSSVTVGANSYPAGNAVDGNPATYWSSDFADPAWLRVDLGESVRIRRVTIDWETAYAEASYGTRGGPLENGKWGGSTHRGNKVYVFAKPWEGDKLRLYPLPGKVTAARNVVGGEAVAFQQTEKGIDLTLVANCRDPFFTVIELTLDVPVPDGTRIKALRPPSEEL